jgi:hypothetical protein
MPSNQDDTAASGVEAEFALYERQILIEVGIVEGEDYLQFLFGFKQYYDSIRPELLEKQFEASGFPLAPLALALQGHSLPRRITLDGHYSQAIAKLCSL